jgi:protein TonB
MNGRGTSWSLGRTWQHREFAAISSTIGSWPLSPLGALIAEIREEQIVARSRAAKTPTRAGHSTKPGRKADLRLETRVVSEAQTARRQARCGLWSASFLLHAALLLGVIALPLLMPEGLLPPASVTRAFFVGPPLIAPPMPPPPPPRVAATPQIRRRPPADEEGRALMAPVETPDRVVPETGGGAIPAGDPGGVEDGVPGGVVGGVLKDRSESPPPTEPFRENKEPIKLKNVAPIYPDIAVRANIQGNVILECTVSPLGQVTDVKVLRGIPLLNAAAVEAAKHWEYTPTLRDGIPVPVIFTVTVTFALR